MFILMIISILAVVLHNIIANKAQDRLLSVLRHEQTFHGYTSRTIKYREYAKYHVIRVTI